MRFRSLLVATLIVSLLAASPAWAQQHVVNRADLRQSMVDKAASDAAKRDVIRDVLRHDAARDVADRYNLDLSQAERAIATLDGEQLESLAASAQLVDTELAGEQTYITISLTVLLLIVIIVLLID